MAKAKSMPQKKNSFQYSFTSLKKYAPLLLLLAGVLLGAYILYSQMFSSESSANSTSRIPKRCGSSCQKASDCLVRESGVPALTCQKGRGRGSEGICVPIRDSDANAACMSDLAAARASKEGIGSPYSAKVSCGGDCTKSSDCDTKAGFRMTCKQVYDSARRAKRKICTPAFARDKNRCKLPSSIIEGTVPSNLSIPRDPGDGFIRP